MSKRSALNGLVLVLLLALLVLGRVLPHPPNFAPAASVALFAGFFFRSRRTAVLPVLIGLLVSDALLPSSDWRLRAVVYAALCLPILWGPLLRRVFAESAAAEGGARRTLAGVLSLGGCAALSSVSFFLISNLAYWQFGGWYASTVDGLVSCYVAALPFYHYTFLGDLAYSGALFGAYVIVTGLARSHAVHSRPGYVEASHARS